MAIRHLVLAHIALMIGAIAPARSTADANLWTPLGPPGLSHTITTFALDPRTPGVVYASTTDGFFKSRDRGASWDMTDPLITFSIAFDPADAATIYAAGSGLGGGVHTSTDGGETWTMFTAGIDYLVVRTVAADPVLPSTVYAGTSRISGSRPTGVFRSEDGGRTWRPTGLAVNGVDMLAVAPTHPVTLFAKAQNAVFRSDDSAQTWLRLDFGGPVAGLVEACDLAVDPLTPSVLHVGTGRGSVRRSSDRGDTSVELTAGLTAASPCALAIDPRVPSTLYAGSERGVFKSTNAGQTWAPMNGGRSIGPIAKLAVDPHSPDRLYAAAVGGLYRLDQEAHFGCGGDCDGNDRLTVDELIAGVGIALGARPLSACPRFDSSGEGAVSIDELTAAVAAAVDTCLPDVFPIDVSDFTQFQFTRDRVRGFCPPPDAVYGAQLFIAEGDSFVFHHEALEAGVPGVDACVPGLLGAGACPVIRAQPARTLTRAEADLVRSVFSQVAVHSRRDPGCLTFDPCLVNSFRWERVTLTDSRCDDRRVDAGQSAAIGALLETLRTGP